MADAPHKAQERWWARFLGGVRRPSQGISSEDIEGPWFVAEHKYRQIEQYSKEFMKAILQHDANSRRESTRANPRENLICFTFHRSVGQNARRFLMIEVFPKDKDIKNLLERILKRIEDEEEAKKVFDLITDNNEDVNG